MGESTGSHAIVTITLTITKDVNGYKIQVSGIAMPGEVELKVYLLGSVDKVPSALIWGLVVLFMVGSGFFLWEKGLREGLRVSSVLLLVEWVFLILCTAVIFRESGERSRINLIPLSSYFDIAEDSYLIEKAALNILNVALFIPIGLLLGLGFKEITWKNALLFGLVVSISIELLQFIFKRGLCETDDLIHNLLGCIIGFAIYNLFTSLIKHVQTFFQKAV